MVSPAGLCIFENMIRQLHPEFKLSGQTFKQPADLLRFVAKEHPEHFDFLQQLFDDNAYIIAQTSGSTGIPKKIKIAKKALQNSAKKTIDFFQLAPQTRALLNLSSGFIAGKLMWVRAITGGWHLEVIAPENKVIKKHLKNRQYDFGAMVPLQVHHNIEYVSNIQKLIIGGGSVSSGLLQKLIDLPSEIYATYGMTEILTHIAVKPLSKVALKDFYTQKKHQGTYQTLKDVVIDSDARSCLVITAPGITNKPVITNDLVMIVDNNHFHWLGRYDNIINSGGVKLIPEQIEQKLMPFFSHDFFVTGIPDDQLGEKLVLVIEGKPLSKLPDFKTILSRFEVPKEIIYLKNFERTLSGKVKRQASLEKIRNL